MDPKWTPPEDRFLAKTLCFPYVFAHFASLKGLNFGSILGPKVLPESPKSQVWRFGNKYPPSILKIPGRLGRNTLFLNKLSISDAPAGPGVIELKVSGLEVVKHQNSMDSGRETFKLAGGHHN